MNVCFKISYKNFETILDYANSNEKKEEKEYTSFLLRNGLLYVLDNKSEIILTRPCFNIGNDNILFDLVLKNFMRPSGNIEWVTFNYSLLCNKKLHVYYYYSCCIGQHQHISYDTYDVINFEIQPRHNYCWYLTSPNSN